MREVPLLARDGSVRAHTLVDDADFEALTVHRWFLTGNPGRQYVGRQVQRSGCRTTVLMHRQIMGLRRGDSREVDHWDLNRLNNQRANLRVVTRRQNCENQLARRTSKSGIRGVFQDPKTGKWIARISRVFDAPEEAEQAIKHWRELIMPYSKEPN